ncbi:N-acetylmuramidase domain-containing protein [Pseudomonas fluorescens]|uniref:N-acetylmuramidase domain-containing protein n=1 Tax=Pseudomonas fluorescens TaxID=294 RepID=UPI002ACABB20|nr:N-acetylmuramidase domain-containing protein [Pseudomonas fluorescens]MDZ5433234.1 N-acetylmuramidase domain-containing protein [Pseudomonas fluorescens]
MLGYIFEVIKDEIGFRRERILRAALPPPTPEIQSSPATPTLGMRILSPPPRPAPSTPPLKNWSHPFGDRANPLQQLTQLANAQAGYYPLGRNGMWHGGVHFDSGIAETEAHSQARCLADGEVVAYRVPERTPLSTFYPEAGGTLEAPFAAGFVLARHHLQAPKINGNNDEPPSLTFFSLYMHLEDWARYEADTALQRPAFWPERNLRVRKDVSNSRPGTSVPRGLKTLTRPDKDGYFLDLLPPDTPVVVSGEGKYRKLEHIRGPASLLNTDGSLQGYVAFRYLEPVGGATYRVSFSGDRLRVRASPNLSGDELLQLRHGTEVTISGEGEYRKLERISQYVLAASLQGERAADAGGNVVVLDDPIPIKAGELIGHLGPYQESDETVPQRKLHLEVFSDDDVEAFFTASRVWAQRLPDKDKTWLKLAKGTPVAAHQDQISANLLPIWRSDNPCCDADLLLPKSLLDRLPPERKIQLPTGTSGKTYTWYRLDGLLHGADGNPLDGWVREEVGVTPWVSPWSWEGHDVLYNYALPQLSLSYLFSVTGVLGEEAQDRVRDRAQKWDNGKLQTRLYEIIDRDRNGKMTADELNAALRVPALAQALAQLVIFSESEWNYRQSKWDALDEVLGHTNSAPILNWVAEKQRIKQLSWWGVVAGKVGLPKEGMVFHFHPIGFIGRLNNNQKKCYCHEQGLIDKPCEKGLVEVTRKHFELLADELGIEKEVLRAIAVAETGDKLPFREYKPGERHALILYERHYMRRLLLNDGMTLPEVNALSDMEPKIVHTYEAGYSYGSLDEQYSRFKRAGEINWTAAIKSCSWGKFQVMGEYYRHLYSSAEELETAQNYCALQHLQYFKVFLIKEKNLIEPMKNKNWTRIAQKYNGMSQIGYNIKIRSAYENLKQNW